MHPIRTGAMPTDRVQCLRIGCTAQRSNTPKKSLPPRTHHPQTGTHEATRPPSTAGVEGARGTCRGAGGRWQGLAGQRVDAPSEARGADGSRAGRRPPAHTAAGSSGTRNTSGATSTPVETFFALACGSSTPVEIFFAHAHPKWLIFYHFHRAGAIFLSRRHPERPPGATQGRSFFQAAPSGPPREPVALPGRGARGRQGLAEAGGADTTASQISHVIYRGHFSRCPKNVAIPTTQMQCLNESSRNYVRSC